MIWPLLITLSPPLVTLFLTYPCSSKIRLLAANQTYLFSNFFDCLKKPHSFSATHSHLLIEIVSDICPLFSIARGKYLLCISEAYVSSIRSYNLPQHFMMKMFKQTEKLKEFCNDFIIIILPCFPS